MNALAHLFVQRGVEVEVLSRLPAATTPPKDASPFPVHFVPYREYRNPLLGVWELNYFSPMRMANRLTMLLSSEHYDILHAHNGLSAIAVLMAKRSGANLPPSVLTVRSYCHVCPLGHGLHFNRSGALRCGPLRTALCVWENGPPSARLAAGLLPFTLSCLALHRLAREAVSCFDRYICISSFLGRVMRTNLGINSELLATIPEFLDIGDLGNSTRADRRGEDSKTILYVGRLVKEKGLLTLLEAFKQVAESDARARLVIVGEGGLLGRLRTWSSEHRLEDRISFVGPVGHGDVADYFTEADIVVVPSLWPEPLGIVTLEALYLGKAVIATAHGGTMDILDDGVNGLLVPPGDPSALAAALLMLLNDSGLRKRLEARGPTSVAEKFGPEELARRTMEVYEELTPNASTDSRGISKSMVVPR